MYAYVPYCKKQRYKDNDKDNVDRFGIVFDVEGMFQSLPQFYLNLLKVFKSHSITIGRVDDFNLEVSYKQKENYFMRQYNMLMFFWQ